VKQFGTFFGLAFSALLPLINPVGDALVFLGLVGAAPPDVYRTLARKIASAAVYICYGRAPALTARVRPETAHGILRVIAFVLLCIGVQITWNGLDTLLKAR
jgi:small neutral amino acid transporter SnatA (MarC family)